MPQIHNYLQIAKSIFFGLKQGIIGMRRLKIKRLAQMQGIVLDVISSASSFLPELLHPAKSEPISKTQSSVQIVFFIIFKVKSSIRAFFIIL